MLNSQQMRSKATIEQKTNELTPSCSEITRVTGSYTSPIRVINSTFFSKEKQKRNKNLKSLLIFTSLLNVIEVGKQWIIVWFGRHVATLICNVYLLGFFASPTYLNLNLSCIGNLSFLPSSFPAVKCFFSSMNTCCNVLPFSLYWVFLSRRRQISRGQ